MHRYTFFLFCIFLPVLAHTEIRPYDTIVRSAFSGDWDKIEERRFLRVLLTTGSTRYFIDHGEQKGITYDVFKQFEDSINASKTKGQVRFHVVFIPTPGELLFAKLLSGEGDVVAAGLTITDARKGLVTFTDPFVSNVSEIIVTNKENSNILTSVDDLSGKSVYVITGSSYQESIEGINRRFVAEGKQPISIELLPASLEDEDVLQMVNANLIPTAVVDDYQANIWSKVLPNIVLHKDAPVRKQGDLAWAVRPGNPQLREKLNDFIKKHGESSSFGEALFNKYYKNVKFVKNATNKDEIVKFEKTLNLFEDHSQKYGIDPLLMIAQGYQESNLNHTARSRVGAIGIMQIMPLTGRELKVGDIKKIEPNIHAGIKYISKLILTHFDEPEITPTNKVFFALAGYNAGPTRINKLRTLAGERGYDKNKWFNNVELIVLEKVGREPVQYVSNIYKYFLAYQMYLAHRKATVMQQAANK